MIFLFDKFKKLKGTVRNRHTISLLYERERNGLYTVSAEIPLKITDKKTVYNYHKKVKDSDFLGHYDREGRFQLHKIASVDIEDSSIFIKGVHLFFDEAKAGAIIQERRFRQSEIIDGARVAFDSIGWSVVDFDVSDTEDYIFYNVSPLEARAVLVETFGFEFDYWLDFDGKNIRNKQISVKREMGKDSNKRYNYGHNVLNIKVEQDYSEIYTAVIGRGKGEDLGDDAYGRRIEFTDVEWKTPSKPMNKPKGSRVLHDENATQLFGYHEDGKVSPRTKVEIFEDIEEPAKLLRASYNWLRENSVPKAVFSLKVPDGDGLDLGDKVHVIYRDIDLVKHTRVTKVVDDLVSGNRDVEFGDTAYFKTDRRLSGVKSELKRVGGSMSSRISRLKAEFDRRFDNEVQQWKDDFEQALIDAEANVEAMRVTMTEEFEAAQKAFEVEFNQSVSDAKKHADAVADAKAEQVQGNLDSFAGRHEQLVGELQGNIVNINGEIADARADVSGILGRLTGVDGSISGIKGSLTEIEGTLTNTKTQLESQITDAKTDLQNQLDEARAELDGLEIGGRNLLLNSNAYVDSRSEKLKLNLDGGVYAEVGYIWGYNFDVSLSKGDVYTISVPVYNISEEEYSIARISGFLGNNLKRIEPKEKSIFTVTKTADADYEGKIYILTNSGNVPLYYGYAKLEKGTVATDWTPAPEDTEQKITNINQSITNIEGELSSKVEQTEVDALKGTVERQGTLLTQTAEEVSSKAEKSVVDTLTGRVSNAESSVTQNAEEIAKKLTKSVYDEDKTATDAKITQWSNLTTETAEGLEQTISRVSTAEGKVTKAQADIKANADEIATKVSSTEFDALTDIVSDSTTAISQNTQNISLKANQSELNQVTNRVSSAESELSVQAGEIELRATKSELDEVEGRVTATEASLTVMDGEISSVVGRVSDNETAISSVVQDVGSITSTVATLEGDVATQGSKIEQTEDAISSKVWMDDIQNIGANLIPFSDTQNQSIMVENWEFLSDGGSTFYTGVTSSNFFTLRNTRSGTTLRMKSRLFDRLVAGKEYTLSFIIQRTSGVNSKYNYTWINRPSGVGNLHLGSPTRITNNGDGSYTHEYVFTSDYTGKVGVTIGSYTDSGQDLWLRVKEPKLERGPKRTPYMTAFSVVEQRAEELSLRVQELSSINGEEILSQSDISVLPDRVLIGSQNIGAIDMASILTVSPSAIDMITNELNLTGNLNVKGQIESISMSAVKADFADLFAARVKAGAVHADYVEGFAAKFSSLYTLNANIERLVSQLVFTNEVKALSLTAVEANIGSIRSKILTSDVILSSHINSSNALIDKIFSSTAMFERMMAKSGFVRTLNTVTIDTDQITIRRPDGGRLISNGVLENTFSIQFIQPRFEGVGVDWSANYYRTTNTSYTTAAAFSYLRGGRYLTVEGYCEMRSAVSGAANTTLGHIRLLEYSSGSKSSFTTIESQATNKGGNQFFRIRIDMGVPQYEQRNFYVQFRTLHSGNAAHFRINQAYYHG